MTDQPETATESKPGFWRTNGPILFGAIGYMIPFFWLLGKTDFPDSFGIHITAHGKVGLFENWYYSYLLLQRHQPWDVILFLYMWAAVVGCVGWLVWKTLGGRKRGRASADSSEPRP